MEAKDVREIAEREGVRFLRLQFTDIFGALKNVEVTAQQFKDALAGSVLFDGSSIEGFARIEESDMLLMPDPNTFCIFPWDNGKGKVGRLLCDVSNPDGTPFEGCPRTTLKKVIAEAADMGFTMMVWPEVEFFLFQRDPSGEATNITHDSGSYFDLTPIDKGEEARRDIVHTLEAMGFEVETAHHEVSPGQHEIDLRQADALTTADNLCTFRFIARKVALDNGLHATFMPKPLYGRSGSGIHIHQWLINKESGKNTFFEAKGESQLSKTAFYYVGGLLRHAYGMVAITNPLINSYKRLVPGFEAPTHVVWSERNVSPLVRVPAQRGTATRCEFRMPDPSCNPYLALAVMLKAGLDGIKNRIDPGKPVNKDIYRMSHRERQRLKIGSLPANLSEALDTLEKDKVIQSALGEHIYKHFLMAKRAEWREYLEQVHPWELARYLSYY